MKYYKLIYMDSFPGKTCAGYAKGYKIYILNRYKNDVGLLEHEKCHVRQWYFTGMFIFSFLYRRAKWFRLWSEVQAYKVQLKYYPQNIDVFAKFIAERYHLNITQEKAKELLGG